MSDVIIPYRFVARRGTAAALAAANETPKNGEFYLATDTGVLKLGDGVTAYNSLMPIPGRLADPSADRILFWDDSAKAYKLLTVGTGLSISGTTLAATGGAGSTEWTLLNDWDFATDGAVASIEAALTGYNECMVVVTDVTLAAAGYRAIQVSSDGGSSYPTSYDYINALGVRATDTKAFMVIHNTTTTASRCGNSQFQLIADAEVLLTGNQSLAGNIYRLPAFGSKPNRVKVGGWTSGGVATNMTAGKVFIYAR